MRDAGQNCPGAAGNDVVDDNYRAALRTEAFMF
jgi:hypothetical protein